jgi:hypothetical protein
MENTDKTNVVRVKKPFLIGAALLLAAVGLQATPVTCASLSGTYASLEAAGSCTIGDKTFSDFTLTSGTVTASEVNYTVVPGTMGNYGFIFQTASLSASGSGASADMSIGFDVAVTNGTKLIDDAALSQAGSILGTGVSTIGETLCLGNTVLSCPAGSTRSLTTSQGAFGTALSDSINFPVQNYVGVEKDLFVASGAMGLASISTFTETFSQDTAPEPGFYGVLAAGVAGIFMFAKRRKKTT